MPKKPFKDQFVSDSDHEQYERDIYDSSSIFKAPKSTLIAVIIMALAFIIALILNI